MSRETAGPWLRTCVTISIWRDRFMEAVGTILGKVLARVMVRK